MIYEDVAAADRNDEIQQRGEEWLSETRCTLLRSKGRDCTLVCSCIYQAPVTLLKLYDAFGECGSHSVRVEEHGVDLFSGNGVVCNAEGDACRIGVVVDRNWC